MSYLLQLKQGLSSYPDRIDILKILTSEGALKYSKLKSLAGYKSRKHSLVFTEHLIKLLRQSLVSLNKSDRNYSITNLGKSVSKMIDEPSFKGAYQ